MPSPPIKPPSKTARDAAWVVSGHMLKIARPLYWHAGVINDGELRGASTFVLQFERLHVAVTADHVMAHYLEARAADPRMICQIGPSAVRPEETLICRSEALDIAVFEVDPRQLGEMGAEAFDCRREWPPREVASGDTITLAGYLDGGRRQVSRGYYEMTAWGAHGVVEDVTERDILTLYEPEMTYEVRDDVTKPPLGFNMSGCSGGPAITVKVINGLLRWFPVGFIYQGPSGKAEGEFASFDRIHLRKLHFIQPDGSIQEPDRGWLPA